MNLQTVMEKLAALSNEKMRAINAKHGAGANLGG